MDRWLVIKSRDERGKYTVLEGNRRFAAIKLLGNPSVMNDLEIRAPIKKKLEELSEAFNLKDIEPIDCFDIGERQAATAWLSQRHTGQNNGRGIVDWGGVATARFRGRDPALQAYELVLNYGGLSEEEKRAIEDRFPITTLDRLLSTPAVRERIGMEISDSKLKSDLPPSELIKPLRKMVLDLASGDWNVTKLKSKDQQIAYVSKFGKDLPNLKKRTGTMKAVDGLEEKDFTSRAPKPRPKPRPVVRKTLIPRDCYLTVSNAKIAEITKELRSLPLADYRHSISVLFRVFLETSVDHYLSAAKIPLTVVVKGHQKDKSLRAKVDEAIAEMVKTGTPKKNLDGVSKGINNSHSPLFHETLHNYVHNRFYSPTEGELKVAWDNAQLFFETIWK